MAKFAVAGIVQVETIVKVDDIPVKYSPVVNKPNTIFTYVGGDAYNERVALKALGDEVEFFSMIGKYDMKGLFWEEDFLGEQDYVLPVLNDTPTAVILYDNKRQQQIFEDIKDMRNVEFNMTLFKEKIQDVDAVVLANANFCRPLAASAKEAGKLLAINFRGFTEEKMQYNEDFFRIADIIYVSDDNIVGSADEFVRKLADNYEARIIILGQGAAGLTIFSREDDLLAHYKPVKTNEIVNTSGAGNSLFSCFMHCYVSSGDAVHAIKNSLLFASYKIGYMGTSRGFLTEEELEHWYRLIWGAGK
ncbi:MAG: carbohydrate kinase family protein [Lachnospiraceae bacterium]|nr:carbohydrate kinase family protein [Lachnospiraceae bacterium]